MNAPPPPPKQIFHITHIDNLAGILREGGLWCDAQRIARTLASTNIGYTHIKNRRLSCRVRTRSNGMLGDYVPFNFCPRSVMLYVVSRGHDDYQGGQDDIVHLVSDVLTAVHLRRPYAFTDRHAELAHSLHFDDLAELGQVPWHVMNETYWSSVKEERQAEFLVHQFFPWEAVHMVATRTPAAAKRVKEAILAHAHQPYVAANPDWYY